MPKSEVSVKGLKGTQKFFLNMHKRVNNGLLKGIKGGLNDIAKDAISASPVYTGALKGSLRRGAQDNVFDVSIDLDRGGVRGSYGTKLDDATYIMGEGPKGEPGRPQVILAKTEKGMNFQLADGTWVNEVPVVTFNQSSPRAGNWTFVGGRAVNLFLYRAFQKNINPIVRKLKEAVKSL